MFFVIKSFFKKGLNNRALGGVLKMVFALWAGPPTPGQVRS